MSRLDELLLLAETIACRADHIVASVAESNTLMTLILQLNDSITAADVQIDSISELVGKNNACLADMEKLYERSLLLEASLHLNELITTETTLDNLQLEHTHLMATFGQQNGIPTGPEEPKPLKNMLSISNLALKPIRCRNTKVAKQKSRYRLSAAYTLNPLQSFPMRNLLESSAQTEHSSIMEHGESTETDASQTSQSPNGTLTGEYNASLHSTGNYDDFALDNLPLLQKRPLDFDAVNLDNIAQQDFDLDSVSSGSSPLRSSDIESFDNFHRFLRQSRVDLRSAFPAPLERSISHESVFSALQLPTQPPPTKFHNPADSIACNKQVVSQPTVETIHSQFDNSFGFKEHSRKLLDRKPQPVTPKKGTHGLFSLMNSPLGSPRGFTSTPVTAVSIPSSDRRNSIDFFSKSLTSGLLSLVGNTSTTPQPREVITAVKPSPPAKIKKLQKDVKNPIAVKNEINSKRLPPPERKSRNVSHSLLTVGPNKTKVIDHGDYSIFKRPAIRRMSQVLLRDALNESILF